VKLITHLRLMPRSKNAWSYTSTPQYDFMAWCLVKAQGQFYFYFTSIQLSMDFLLCNVFNTLRDFDILTAVKIHVEIFWVVMPDNVVIGYQRFRGLSCLRLHPESRNIKILWNVPELRLNGPRLESSPPCKPHPTESLV
jgi:hypothetical protein